jgi:hypothetical protein
MFEHTFDLQYTYMISFHSYVLLAINVKDTRLIMFDLFSIIIHPQGQSAHHFTAFFTPLSWLIFLHYL